MRDEEAGVIQNCVLQRPFALIIIMNIFKRNKPRILQKHVTFYAILPNYWTKNEICI